MSNREILIKLAEGKKFTRKAWEFGARIFMDNEGRIMYVDDATLTPRYHNFTDDSGWQEVFEPMRWEGVGSVTNHHGCWSQGLLYVDALPKAFEGKRIRVVVEEILP
jgi:hypothetical protein